MAYRPKYMKKRPRSKSWIRRAGKFFDFAFQWFPVWASPALALAAALSFLAGDIIIMAGAITCFFCAIVSSVLLAQADTLEQKRKSAKTQKSRSAKRCGISYDNSSHDSISIHDPVKGATALL